MHIAAESIYLSVYYTSLPAFANSSFPYVENKKKNAIFSPMTIKDFLDKPLDKSSWLEEECLQNNIGIGFVLWHSLDSLSSSTSALLLRLHS